jgi:hypothetical protein
MTVRAAVHVALAHRGGRLGLYDLRETLEGASAPLPVEFVAALTAIGDASCLEPIVAAYARTRPAPRPGHDWWHERLADAFQTIVTRERVTRRHAVMKRIERRWPEAARDLRAADAARPRRAG